MRGSGAAEKTIKERHDESNVILSRWKTKTKAIDSKHFCHEALWEQLIMQHISCGRLAITVLVALLAFSSRKLVVDAAVAPPQANNIFPPSDSITLFESPAQNNLTSAVAVMTGRSVQIPCGVASPDTHVALYRVSGGADGRERTRLRLQRPGSAAAEADAPLQFGLKDVHYSPATGFTANVASLAARGLYVCRAERGGSSEERRVFISVVDDSPHAILQPWLLSIFGYSFARGSTMAITCSVNVRRGNPVSIGWSKDGAPIDVEKDSRIFISPITYSPPCTECSDGRLLHGYVEATSRLIIVPVLQTDAGDYECTASSYGQRRTARQQVLVSEFTRWDGETINSDGVASRERGGSRWTD